MTAMLRKEKKKVVDEVWTDERIRRFLHLLPPEGVDCDFHRLRRAYQAMRPEDFED
ncbi:MAG: PA4642 family protein, partial [Pseudomonadales bacterium]|nr:PA4642 family protein [Pseudomonadales bacterium]